MVTIGDSLSEIQILNGHFAADHSVRISDRESLERSLGFNLSTRFFCFKSRVAIEFETAEKSAAFRELP